MCIRDSASSARRGCSGPLQRSLWADGGISAYERDCPPSKPLNTLEKKKVRIQETQIMKRRDYIVPIVMGLAFALPPTLVSARISADKSVKSCDDDKAGTGNSTLTHETAFVCDRLALNREARRRHFVELGPALRGLKKQVRELSDGYEFQFPSDPKTIAMVAEWAAGERLCCPFLSLIHI